MAVVPGDPGGGPSGAPRRVDHCRQRVQVRRVVHIGRDAQVLKFAFRPGLANRDPCHYTLRLCPAPVLSGVSSFAWLTALSTASQASSEATMPRLATFTSRVTSLVVTV